MWAGKSLNEREKNSGEEVKKSRSLLFFARVFFLARLDFFPSPVTASGSPRMSVIKIV